MQYLVKNKVVSQHCECTECQWIEFIKIVNFILCEFHLNKTCLNVIRGLFCTVEIYLQINNLINDVFLTIKNLLELPTIQCLSHTRLSWHSLHQFSHNNTTDINYRIITEQFLYVHYSFSIIIIKILWWRNNLCKIYTHTYI